MSPPPLPIAVELIGHENYPNLHATLVSTLARFGWTPRISLGDAADLPANGLPDTLADQTVTIILLGSKSNAEAGATATDQLISWLKDQDLDENNPVVVVFDRTRGDDAIEEIVDTPLAERRVFGSFADRPFLRILRSIDWQDSANSSEVESALATAIARQVYQVFAPRTKFVLIDDALLWDTTEDGTHQAASAHREMQRYLLNLQQQGMLLGYVGPDQIGKDMATARDMLLKEDAFIRGTNTSSDPVASLQSLSESLDIPLRQMLYLTTDCTAAARLAEACPSSLAFAIPEDPKHRLSFAEALWALDDLWYGKPLSPESLARYQVAMKRKAFKDSSGDFHDFLKGLKLVIDRVSPKQEHHDRMSQLANQTKHVNATSRRFTPAEVKSWLGRPYHYAVLYHVRDRFGDYGITGMIMYERVKRTLLVHNFLLSSPVVGKGAEHQMLADLGELAAQHDCVDIDLPFLSTPDNSATKELFSATIGACRQQLPEDNWCVFQVPSEVAKDIASRKPIPLRVDQTDSGKASTEVPTVPAAPSAVLHEFASQRTTSPATTTDSKRSGLEPEPEPELEEPPTELITPEPRFASPFSINATEHSKPAPPSHPLKPPAKSATPFIIEPPIAESPAKPDLRELTPNQRWFFDQRFEGQDHWNQAYLFTVPATIDGTLLERSLKHVIEHHPALGARFVLHGDKWQQQFTALETQEVLRTVDLSRTSDDSVAAQIDCIATATQGRLNLMQGKLIRAVYFDLGDSRSGTLLLTIHQLACDGPSWPILIRDLETCYTAFGSGATPVLPASHDYHSYWNQLCPDDSDLLAAWKAVTHQVTRPKCLASDFENPARNIVCSASSIEQTLSKTETTQLPTDETNDLRAVLATALGGALRDSESKSVAFQFEANARNLAPDSSAVEAPVGWFTATHPVVLTLENGTTPELVLNVAEQIESLPHRGLSMPYVRHSLQLPGGALPLLWRHQPTPPTLHDASTLFSLADERIPACHSPRALRPAEIELETEIIEGQLEIRWIYSQRLHKPTTIQRLADSFQAQLRKLIPAIAENVAEPAPADTVETVAAEVASASAIPPAPVGFAMAAVKDLLNDSPRSKQEAEPPAADETQARGSQSGEGSVPVEPYSRPHLLLASAETPSSLNALCQDLAKTLAAHADYHVDDVAYTLANDRPFLCQRRALVATGRDDAIAALTAPNSNVTAASGSRPIIFLFPGQGTLDQGMGRELYEQAPAFREVIDWCSEILLQLLKVDLRDALYQAGEPSFQTHPTLMDPALFVTEFALARLWMSWGLCPDATAGHGIGEYVSACLSGVFTLEEGLAMVAKRAQLIGGMPEGRMLTVHATPNAVMPFLRQQVDVAAYNGRTEIVVSGPSEAIADLERELAVQRIESDRIATKRALHSKVMEQIRGPYATVLQHVAFQPPQLPFVSNVSGDWIRDDQACDPDYWACHLHQTIRFEDCLTVLLEDDNSILLEVGAGDSLSRLANAHPDRSHQHITPSIAAESGKHELESTLLTLGALWEHGASIDWATFYDGDVRQPLDLPMPSTDAPVEPQPVEPEAHVTDQAVEEPPGKPDTEIEEQSVETPPTGREEHAVEELPVKADGEVEGPPIEDEANDQLTESEETAPPPEPSVARPADDPILTLALKEADAQPVETAQPISTSIDAALDNRLNSIEADLLEIKVHLAARTPADPSIANIAPKAGRAYPDPVDQTQREHLDRLRERWTQHTKQSCELIDHYRTRSGWLTTSGDYPIVIRGASASLLWDADDHEYVDIDLQAGANFYGHRPDFIAEAIREQLVSSDHSHRPLQIELEITDLIKGFSKHAKVRLTNSSGQALKEAIAVASEVTGKQGVSKFPSDPNAWDGYIEMLASQAGYLAAVLIDVIPFEWASYQEDIFAKLHAASRDASVALIMDETRTGLRCHEHGLAVMLKVQPDLTIYGNQIAGGYPFGVVAGSETYLSTNAAQAITNANPLTLAAARAFLTDFLERGTSFRTQLNARTSAFVEDMNAIAKEVNAEVKTNQFGSIFGFQFPNAQPFGSLLASHMCLRGVHVVDSEACYLSLAHSEDNLKTVARAFAESLTELQVGGFLNTEPSDREDPPRDVRSTAKPVAGVPVAEREDPALREARAYWTGKFQYPLSPLQLPEETSKCPESSDAFQHQSLTLRPDLHELLEAFCSTHQIASADLMLGVFHTLIAKLSSQDDFAIATLQDQNLDSIHDNDAWLPVRLPLTENDSIQHFIKTVSQEARNTRLHSSFPTEELNLLQNPPAKVFFVVNRSSASIEPKLSADSPFELGLAACQSTDKLGTLQAFYRTDRFAAETIGRWLNHTVTLISNLLEAPLEKSLRFLSLLSKAEIQTLVVSRNMSTTGDAPRRCVHELLETIAAKTPAKIAIHEGSQRLNYGHLNRRANQLAHYLRELGVEPETPVAVYSERCTDMVIAWLGILKAGAAYVALDPADPIEVTQNTLEDLQAPIILTQASLQGRFMGRVSTEATLIDLNNPVPDPYESAIEDPVHRTTREATACITYTGLGDGQRQAVTIPHRGIVRLVKNTDYASFGPSDVLLLSSPLSADACTLEVWGPLLNGGTLAIPTTLTPSAQEIADSLVGHRVTLLLTGGEQLEELLTDHSTALNSVRQLLVSNATNARLIRRAYEELTCQIIHFYGPIENSVITCCHTVTDEDLGRDNIPVGLPIPNTQTYLLDRYLQPAPVGVVGDLYVGGEGLASGYLNNFDLNERSFIDHPFSEQTAAQLFRTGDRGRWLPSGEIELVETPAKIDLGAPMPSIGAASASAESSAAPVFFITTINDNQPLTKQLASSLASHCPYREINTSGAIDGATVEQLAEHCFEQIRALNPRGPFIIGGGLHGGMIAYELAQKIFATGEPVDMLVLFDTPNPAAELLPDSFKISDPVFAGYVPKVYPGTLILFNTQADATASLEHRQLGWHGLARGGVTVIPASSQQNLITKFQSLLDASKSLESN